MKTKITVEKDMSREDWGIHCHVSVTVERDMGVSVMKETLMGLVETVRNEVQVSVDDLGDL